MAYYISRYGTRIDIGNMSEKDINLRDISHHLGKICRYGGSLPIDVHYSVAQHSILLAKYACDEGYPLEVQRALLLHDATEAYLGDIVSGLKKYLPDYTRIESELDAIIKRKYNITESTYTKQIVKEFDSRIIMDEMYAFFKEEQHYHFIEQMPDLKPLGVKPLNEYTHRGIHDWAHIFANRCHCLGIKD